MGRPKKIKTTETPNALTQETFAKTDRGEELNKAAVQPQQPNWILNGGEVQVRVLEMPIVDLFIRCIIEPEGLIKVFKKYPTSPVIPVSLETFIHQDLQEDLDKAYEPRPAPAITKVILIRCDMTPISPTDLPVKALPVTSVLGFTAAQMEAYYKQNPDARPASETSDAAATLDVK